MKMARISIIQGIAVLYCLVTLGSANIILPSVAHELAAVRENNENKSPCSKFSCEGYCWTNIYTNGKRCSCNEICLEWNNCCSDFLTVCKGITEPNITDYVLQEIDQTVAFFRSFGTCNYYIGPGYTNIIGRCPDAAPQYLKDACHNLSTYMPPMQHNENYLLNFANVHCALCHGFNISDVIVWEFDFLCDKKYTVDVQTITDRCTKIFPGIKRMEQLMCYPFWNHKELIKPDYKSMCEQYIRPIMLNGVIYKNIDCAKTELTNSSASSTSVCLDIDHSFIFDNNIRVLFDFKGNSVRIQKKISFSLCESSQIYDPYFMICRDIICPQDHYAHLGQCYRNQTIFINAKDQPFPFLNQSTKVKFSYHFLTGNLARNFYRHEGMTLLNISEEMPDPNTPLLCKINHLRSTNTFNTFNVVAEILLTSLDDNLDMLISALAQDRCISSITLSNVDSHVDSDLCPNSYLQRYSEVHTEILGLQRYAVMEKDQQKVFYSFHNIGFKISVSKYLSSGLIDEIYVCVTDKAKHNLTCPIVALKTGEYILRNDSIEITKGSKIIPKDQFVLIGDDAHVCSFYDGFKLNFFDYNHSQQLLSLIVTCISTLCLSLSLFIYIRYKEMRTLGGKLNASLCFWLLLGQGTLQVNSEVEEICQILATVCHFAWLSAFSTMTAIAVNMALTFHKTKLLDENEQEVRYKRLLSASFIVPSAIVAVCAGLDFGNTNERWSVGYGKGVCTWMSNSIGIIVAFYVPICMSLSVNVVSFIITLCGIERSSISSSVTNFENHRPYRQRCLIYTKLSFIMGLTWIFGIVGAVAQNEILWYVFIIFNGLQGFFIFLSFICNRRTWNIIGCPCGVERSSVYASSQSNKNTNSNKDVSA